MAEISDDITKNGSYSYRDLQRLNALNQQGYNDADLRSLQEHEAARLAHLTDWDDSLVQSDVMRNSDGKDWFG